MQFLSHAVATPVFGPGQGCRVVSVNGKDAFCVPTVLILATGMSINSSGSGLEAFTMPHTSPPSKPAFNPSFWFWSTEEMSISPENPEMPNVAFG